MKVLTEEEQVQQGAFLWGATTADSQVGLGLSCGLWILMMVQWSRYANLQCSFSPVSAEKSGCVRICNLCCGSAPPIFFFFFFLYARPIASTLSFASYSRVSVSVSLPLTFHTFSSCFHTPLLQYVFALVPSVHLLPASISYVSVGLLHTPNTITDD